MNTTLTKILYMTNHIGDEGGKAIGEACHKLTISTFRPKRNIGDEGGKAIGEASAAANTWMIEFPYPLAITHKGNQRGIEANQVDLYLRNLIHW